MKRSILIVTLSLSFSLFGEVGERLASDAGVRFLPELAFLSESMGQVSQSLATVPAQPASFSPGGSNGESSGPAVVAEEVQVAIDGSKAIAQPSVGESTLQVLTDGPVTEAEASQALSGIGNASALLTTAQQIEDQGKTAIPMAKVMDLSPSFSRKAKEGVYESKKDPDKKLVVKGLSQSGTSFGAIGGDGSIFENAALSQQASQNAGPKAAEPEAKKPKTDEEKEKEREKELRAEKEFRTGLEYWSGMDPESITDENKYYEMRQLFSDHEDRFGKLDSEEIPDGFIKVADRLIENFGKVDNSEDKYPMQNFLSKHNPYRVVFRPQDAVLESERIPNHKNEPRTTK